MQIPSIIKNLDFTLRIKARRIGFNKYVNVSFEEIANITANLVRLPSLKSSVSCSIDSEGRLVIPITGEQLVCTSYGIELLGFYNNGNWRHQITPAFQIVMTSTEDNYALTESDNLTIDLEIVIGETYASNRMVETSVNEHNEAQTAHPYILQQLATLAQTVADIATAAAGGIASHNTSNTAHQDMRDSISGLSSAMQNAEEAILALQTAIQSAGKVDDVQIDGTSILDNKVANIDSSQFGKVDDVLVNGSSVVNNKEANITVPTKVSDLDNDENFATEEQVNTVAEQVSSLSTNMPTKVSDLDNDSEFVTEAEAEQMVENAATEITIGSTTTVEPGTDATVTNSGTSKAPVLNFNIPRGNVGPQGAEGPQGLPGATVHYDAATDVVLDTKPGDSTVMGMTQKAITKEFGLVRDSCEDYEVINSDDLTKQDCALGNPNWAKTNNGTQSHVAIPVEYGQKVRIIPTSTHTGAFIGFLETYNPPYTNGSKAIYAPDQARITISTNSVSTFAVPKRAHWLILTTTDYSLNEVSYQVEVVRETSIEAIASAKEMTEVANRRADVMASATTLLNTNVAEVAGYINTSTHSWGASTVNFSKFVDVRKYRGRKIRVVKNPNGLCQFAFVNNTNTTGAASYSWDNRTIDVSAETGAVELYVPYGANYMYMRSTTTNSTDITPTIYVWSDIALELSDDTTFMKESDVDISSAAIQDCSLGSSSWYGNTTNHSSHFVIPVKPKEVYRITDSVGGFFAFLTEDYLTPASGAIPFVPLTSRDNVSAGVPKTIIVPDGCAYIAFNNIDGAGTANVWTIEKGGLARTLPMPEPESQAVAPPLRLRVCSWNVGHFALGAGTSSVITHEQYPAMRQKWAEGLNSVSADIMLCHEFCKNFVNAEGGEAAITAASSILSQYPYNYIGVQAGYICEALFSTLPLIDVQNVNRGGGRDIRVGTLLVGDDVIKVGATHLDWQDSEGRAADIQFIIEHFADDEMVIIGADWNVGNMSEYDAFTAAGWKMVNHGYLGNIPTYPAGSPNGVIDNIVCKGFNLCNTGVLDDAELSDHCAIYADFTTIR